MLLKFLAKLQPLRDPDKHRERLTDIAAYRDK